eukprot:15441541-Alexandrium_andersonii.AAC.1
MSATVSQSSQRLTGSEAVCVQSGHVALVATAAAAAEEPPGPAAVCAPWPSPPPAFCAPEEPAPAE